MNSSASNGSSVNTTGKFEATRETPGNFTFPDIVIGDLFLPDLDPGQDADSGETTLGNTWPGTAGVTENSLACAGTSFCPGLFNSTGFPERGDPGVVESSTRHFTESDLWAENDYFALLNIPAMVFIAVLMVFGIVGNILVVYVYGFKFKATTQHFLIVCLACLDLLMACIAMPTDIADLRFHHTFSSLAACKLLRFITMFSSTSSSFTLVTIAWDRHKRVTRPLTRQMTLKDAKVWEGVNLAAAVFFSWPLLVMTGLRTSETRVPGLFGTDCSFSDAFHATRWPLFYNSILGLGFVVMVVVLGTLYYQIWKRAKRHRVYMAQRMDRGPSSSTSAVDDVIDRTPRDHYMNGTDQGGQGIARSSENIRTFKRGSLKFVNRLDDDGCPGRGGSDGYDNDACMDFSQQFGKDMQPCVRYNHTIASVLDFPSPIFSESVNGTNNKDLGLPSSQVDDAAHNRLQNSLAKTARLHAFNPEPAMCQDVGRDPTSGLGQSESTILDQSPREDNKDFVPPTISSNSVLTLDESKCLLSRSQSLASLHKRNMLTKTPDSRRVSLPYLCTDRTKQKHNPDLSSQAILREMFRGKPHSLKIDKVNPYHLNFKGDNVNHGKKDNDREGSVCEVPDADKEHNNSMTCGDLLEQCDSEGPSGNENVLRQHTEDLENGEIGAASTDHKCYFSDRQIQNSPLGERPGSDLTNGATDSSDWGRESSSTTKDSENGCIQIGPNGVNYGCNATIYQIQKGSKSSVRTNPLSSSNTGIKPAPRTSLPCPTHTPTIRGPEVSDRRRFLSINSLSSVGPLTLFYNKQNENPKRFSKNIDKTTIVAFAVSIVFVVSFLPYLILMFVRAFVEDFDYKLQDGTLWLYSCFLRFYLLNSAVNPLLYGWLNQRFRTESKRLLCCCHGNKRVPE